MDIKNGSFLITGGASLIGSHLAGQLIEAGAARVILYDNLSLGSEHLVSHLLRDGRVKLVRGDILRQGQLMEALDGIDGVFAVAGFLTLPLSHDPWVGIEVNVRGHHTVLEACRWRGIRKVVFSSSAAVYGAAQSERVVETDPLAVEGLQPGGAIYGATKVIGEQLCRLYRDRHGIDYVALRYSTVYGERQHYRGVNALYIIEAYDRIRRGLAPVLPGNGREVHDYVYVGDVARANVMAMGSEVSGESFTIATGIETTLNELVAIILELAGSKLKPEYADDPAKIRFTTSEKLTYARDKAARLLGWEPKVSVREGVRRLIEWHEAGLLAKADA